MYCLGGSDPVVRVSSFGAIAREKLQGNGSERFAAGSLKFTVFVVAANG